MGKNRSRKREVWDQEAHYLSIITVESGNDKLTHDHKTKMKCSRRKIPLMSVSSYCIKYNWKTWYEHQYRVHKKARIWVSGTTVKRRKETATMDYKTWRIPVQKHTFPLFTEELFFSQASRAMVLLNNWWFCYLIID